MSKLAPKKKRCPECGAVLREPPTDTNERLAYDARADPCGYSWARIAKFAGLSHASSARAYARRFAARYGLPWPPEPIPKHVDGDDDEERTDN